jgi:hypothetical protein
VGRAQAARLRVAVLIVKNDPPGNGWIFLLFFILTFYKKYDTLFESGGVKIF